MKAGDETAVWIQQAWLFYSDQAFWQPPQIQVECLASRLALLHAGSLGQSAVACFLGLSFMGP